MNWNFISRAVVVIAAALIALPSTGAAQWDPESGDTGQGPSLLII